MTDNGLLHKIGKLIDQRLEPIKKEMVTKSDLDAVKNDLQEMRQGQTSLEQGQKSLKNDVLTLKEVQAQTNTSLGQIKTVLKALEAGQESTKAELKADIHDLGVKMEKYQKKNEQRFENLEEHTGIPNPHKN